MRTPLGVRATGSGPKLVRLRCWRGKSAITSWRLGHSLRLLLGQSLQPIAAPWDQPLKTQPCQGPSRARTGRPLCTRSNCTPRGDPRSTRRLSWQLTRTTSA
jgi:hypothetical protein